MGHFAKPAKSKRLRTIFLTQALEHESSVAPLNSYSNATKHIHEHIIRRPVVTHISGARVQAFNQAGGTRMKSTKSFHRKRNEFSLLLLSHLLVLAQLPLVVIVSSSECTIHA